jgi:hypothetical protein
LSLFGLPLLWRGWFRVALFWGSFAATLIVLARSAPHSEWSHVFAVLREVGNGDIEHVSERSFAFALSSGIGQIAVALAVAFLASHVLLLQMTLRGAKGLLGRRGDLAGFAQAFDAISGRLERNAVVGHGWRQFTATVIREDHVIRYTVRPQTYINLADARGELFGLKMMGSIPRYFVGLGLLGLVLALNRAAGSTAAGSAEAMTSSLNELLAAVTFKFSTSIAGLGASLGLALAFRTYQIWIEGAFEGFSRALEQRMIFSAPQRIAEDSRQILAAQRDQLKEINSERFFARLGESVAPALGNAITQAVGPLSDRLERTTEELARTSRAGADSLVQNFVDRLDQGASREMQEIVGTLKSVRDALDRTQLNLSGTGQDFSSKLTQAADAIGRVLADASKSLSGSAGDVATSVNTGSLGSWKVSKLSQRDLAARSQTCRLDCSSIGGQHPAIRQRGRSGGCGLDRGRAHDNERRACGDGRYRCHAAKRDCRAFRHVAISFVGSVRANGTDRNHQRSLARHG